MPHLRILNSVHGSPVAINIETVAFVKEVLTADGKKACRVSFGRGEFDFVDVYGSFDRIVDFINDVD